MAYPIISPLTVTPVLSAQTQQTTPNSQPSLQKVTIVHPFHPLRGQQVTVVRRYAKEPASTLLVQLPDQSHTLIELDMTDAAMDIGDTPPIEFPHLLDFEGLCQVARMVQRLQQANEAVELSNQD